MNWTKTFNKFTDCLCANYRISLEGQLRQKEVSKTPYQPVKNAGHGGVICHPSYREA
jgi:hypothetical protein